MSNLRLSGSVILLACTCLGVGLNRAINEGELLWLAWTILAVLLAVLAELLRWRLK